MHQSYEFRMNRPQDFRVWYRFFDESEGGRETLPAQGYRSDFWYFHEEQPNPYTVHMIWPEFENGQGDVITDTELPVNPIGTARMWVIAPEKRQMHRSRIKVGMTVYLMEGPRRVAECRVIEILGLQPGSDLISTPAT